MGRHSHTLVRAPRPRFLIPAISAVAVLALAGGALIAWHSGLNPGAAQAAALHQSACNGTAKLTVTADPEVAPIVKQVAQKYDGVASHCSAITVTAQNSADTASEIAAGDGGSIGVWIPDSPVWINRMQSIAASLGRSAPAVKQESAIASSPVLFALPARQAGNVGSTPLSWGRVLNGSVPAVIPDPEASGASLAGLLALAGQAHGNTEELNTALIALGKSIPASAGAAFDAVNSATTLTVAIATEQEVAAYNDDADHSGSQLTAVYPAGGTLSVEYPYLLVNAGVAGGAAGSPAASPAVKASVRPAATTASAASPGPAASPAPSATEAAATAKLAAAFQQTLLAQPQLFTAAGFRTGSGRGSVDQPGVVATPAPFEAASDGATELALYKTWGVLTLRGRMLGVIDVSGSMADEATGGLTRIQVFQQAAMGAIQRFSGDVELGLWMFSTNQDGTLPYKQISPIAPLGDPNHMQDLANQVAALPSHVSGDTGLYDTVIAAVQNVRQSYDPKYINSVVVITDGVNDDSASSTTLEQTVATLKQEADPTKPVPVIMIGFGPDTDMAAMKEIAQATGGAAYSAQQPQDLGTVLTTALTERSCRPNCAAG